MPPGESLDRSLPLAVHGVEVELDAVALMPHLAIVPCAASSKSSDAWSSAFDGMQPTLRQVPPSVSRLSAQAVFSPSCAARIAAT